MGKWVIILALQIPSRALSCCGFCPYILRYMLRIRLQRLGRNKQPSYRVIISEQYRDTQHGSIEILGTYNPTLKPKMISLNVDRIKYWISVGAQPSETLNNLFISEGIITGKKTKPVSITKKRAKKLDAKKAQA